MRCECFVEQVSTSSFLRVHCASCTVHTSVRGFVFAVVFAFVFAAAFTFAFVFATAAAQM